MATNIAAGTSVVSALIQAETPAIEISGVVKRYGAHTAVDHVSFTVKRGEIFGLLGPNGAGKTTALEIIEGLRLADEGKVSVLGLDVRRQRRAVQARIGVQLQATTLFPELTARETIALFGAFYPHAIPTDDLLREVGLEQKAEEPSTGPLRWAAPAIRARPGAGQRSRAHLPGRADHGAGPAEPAHAMGDGAAAARARQDGCADDALHG